MKGMDGIFGYSLVFELIVVYTALNQVYGKTIDRWLYAIVILLIFNFILGLSAGNWYNLFRGDWGFIFNPFSNWFN